MGEPKPARVLNWTPLEKAVPPSFLGAFMHMGEVRTIQQYKHRDKRRYLYIDSDCTRFYDLRGRGEDTVFVETDRGAALRRVLEMCCCEDPYPPFDPPQEEFNALTVGAGTEGARAASLLEGFLKFQCAVNWWVLDEPDEWETLLVFPSLNYEMLGLAGLITEQLRGHSRSSFERRAREIQVVLEKLWVPSTWLAQPEEGDRSPATMVRAWRTFCELVAKETGEAPTYGVLRPQEPSWTEEPSQAEAAADQELPPEEMDVPQELAILCPANTAQEAMGFWGRLRKTLGP